MAWIELHQAIWTHRKTFELAGILDMDETYAAAHLIRLWTWSIDNAPDGDLSGVSDRAIAMGSGYRDDAAAFVRALTDSGWLDDDRHIHDWYEYAGRLQDKREANAERMRQARAKHKPLTLDSGADNVQRTYGARAGATVPDLTGPNRTIPEDEAPESDDSRAPPLRSAALSPSQKSQADNFSQALTGINGFQPTTEFMAKVVTKYEALDLEECALAIAGHAKKKPKWLNNASILNWLRNDLDRLNNPQERTPRNGTDHGTVRQRAPTGPPISDEAREYVRNLGTGVTS